MIDAGAVDGVGEAAPQEEGFVFASSVCVLLDDETTAFISEFGITPKAVRSLEAF